MTILTIAAVMMNIPEQRRMVRVTFLRTETLNFQRRGKGTPDHGDVSSSHWDLMQS